MPSGSLEALSLTLPAGRYFGTVDCGVRRKARASASCWFFSEAVSFPEVRCLRPLGGVCNGPRYWEAKTTRSGSSEALRPSRCRA